MTGGRVATLLHQTSRLRRSHQCTHALASTTQADPGSSLAISRWITTSVSCTGLGRPIDACVLTSTSSAIQCQRSASTAPLRRTRKASGTNRSTITRNQATTASTATATPGSDGPPPSAPVSSARSKGKGKAEPQQEATPAQPSLESETKTEKRNSSARKIRDAEGPATAASFAPSTEPEPAGHAETGQAAQAKADTDPPRVIEIVQGERPKSDTDKQVASDSTSLARVPYDPSRDRRRSTGDSAADQESLRSATAKYDLPLPSTHDSLPAVRHPFNTHRFVQKLENAGWPRGEAEEVMRATRALLTMSEKQAAQNLVGRSDLENEAYLFSAALSELRTEVQVKARNDGISLRSMGNQVQRETDSLNQKLGEDIAGLKNEIQLDINARKEEASVDQKSLELKIIDLSNKFTVLLGDVRTDLEARKWLLTRRSITMIGALVVLVIASNVLVDAPKEEPPAPLPSVFDLGVEPVANAPAADDGFLSGWFRKSDNQQGSAPSGPDEKRPPSSS
ncbi:uncharacterized protein L969DRAFT_55244 [Mixia osmundae IAM 14324]|uniref:DUF1640 domain-containing protein n=1 Tax=Mixia osmundae (strain CBS 9802 / IAM 14324 / JCM 22182 / KY 12970) TaxID=764103 RepID=G7DUL9_MIXOS|nr:uncharacterized protein L969DRAFT_55244 [Mixia osmundae IAM 14324]KEI36387.1 hypothetical protein L969DRAFT_55244 [Mixia osmundae IAM 14324]GAA94279.1 hypothetical protein E5Q_00928 [Mixia osmundae IAM 14324]